MPHTCAWNELDPTLVTVMPRPRKLPLGVIVKDGGFTRGAGGVEVGAGVVTIEVTVPEQVEVATVEDASVAWMFATYVPFAEYDATIAVLVLPVTPGLPDHASAYGALPPAAVTFHVITLFETEPVHETESAVVVAPTIDTTARMPIVTIPNPPANFALEIIDFIAIYTMLSTFGFPIWYMIRHSGPFATVDYLRP